MTPSPDLSPIEPKLKPLPSKNLDLANGIQYTREPTAEGDDRSSSLSEIGDRTGNEDIGSTRLAPLDGSEANDTEAETERLEDSPQRTRKHTLTSSNRILSNGASPRVTGVNPKNNSLGQSGFPNYSLSLADRPDRFRH